MENKPVPPTEIQALAEAVRALGLHHEVHMRILAVLQEHEKVLYAQREDMKMLRASASSADRISREALIKLADLQRDFRSSK